MTWREKVISRTLGEMASSLSSRRDTIREPTTPQCECVIWRSRIFSKRMAAREPRWMVRTVLCCGAVWFFMCEQTGFGGFALSWRAVQ
jgi:hypothetical protein